MSRDNKARKGNKMKDIKVSKLVAFLDENADILHVSRYHREDFRTHCLLVIGAMQEQYKAGNVSEEAMVAAFLHDIAKPRTAALNKRNEACFYGHEQVTDEELIEFLDSSYAGFDKVAALIRAHMLPLGIGGSTPEPFRSQNQQRLNDILGNWDQQFEKDLMILSECDLRSSIRSDEDLVIAKKEAESIRNELLSNA